MMTELLYNSAESVFRFIREIALLLVPVKYYRRDALDEKPIAFTAIIKAVRTKTHFLSKTHWVLRCTYGNETRETYIFLKKDFDPKKPSIVFHHPSGETSHSFAANVILGGKLSAYCNIFLIKAQKHDSTKEFLEECVDSFLHHQLTFAGSALAVEAIRRYHHARTKTKIVVTGASMGGIVSSLHAYFFGTADYYFPLAAYPNVGEIFMGSSYRFGIDSWRVRRHNKTYLSSFDFKKPFPKGVTSRITPVLGRCDRIVPFDAAISFWKRNTVICRIYPFGHFTPAIVRHEIRQMISEQLL